MATENRHIEQIDSTRVGLQANLDNLQIAIETDNSEGLVYKDDDGTYHKVANLEEAVTFTTIGATDVVSVAQYIKHTGDTDTLIDFSTNRIDLTAGNITMLVLQETTQDIISVNPNAVDVDFKVSASGAANALFVQGSDGKVGMGTNAPSYLLHVVGEIGASRTLGLALVGHEFGTAEFSQNLRAASGKHNSITFTEESVADRWAIGTKAADGTLYFSSGDSLNSGTVQATLSNTSIFTVGLARPVSINGAAEQGYVQIKGPSGAWATRFSFAGSGGTGLGGLWGFGNTDALTYFNLGTAYDDGHLKVTAAGSVSMAHDLSVLGGAVFNEDSADVDFRVESNGNANMLFVDAGNDRVGIGTGTPGCALCINGGVNVGGDVDAGDNHLIVTGRVGVGRAPITDGLIQVTISSGLTTGDSMLDMGNASGVSPYAFIEARLGDTTEGAHLALQPWGGYVGIYTVSPDCALCVNGGVHVGGDSDAGDNNLLVDGNTSTKSLTGNGTQTVDIDAAADVTPANFAIELTNTTHVGYPVATLLAGSLPVNSIIVISSVTASYSNILIHSAGMDIQLDGSYYTAWSFIKSSVGWLPIGFQAAA